MSTTAEPAVDAGAEPPARGSGTPATSGETGDASATGDSGRVEQPVARLRAALARRPVGAATLAGALCVLLHAVAYALGWADHYGVALTLWYVAFVLLCAPFAWLLLSPTARPRQRLLASLSFSMLLYLSWLLTSPVLAIRFDETLHVTTLAMLTDGGGLFAPNTMLPVSPHYPGLELAAAGVHWVSGLPLFLCQIAVVAVARATLVVALFLLASRIGHSARVGGVAVLLYAASAQFYFFNAQFSYQTVAIAMVMAAVYLLLRAADAPERRPWALLWGVQACLAALAVTHHLTSWLALVTLWALALLFWAGGERRRAAVLLVTAEIATVVMAAWTAIVAPLLVDYLTPIFGEASDEIQRLMLLEAGREVAGGGVTPTPLWETGVMAVASLLWCLLLLPAALAALRGSSMPRSSGRILPLLLAAAYPALLLARFSPRAAEIADRASTFVTMALAVVIAAWVAPRLGRWRRTSAVTAVVLLLGGVILGNGPDWQRVPGPYLPAAEQRSVDGETIAVAQWAARYLPAGSRIAADSTMNRVLPNFADVVPVTGSAGSENVTPLFIYDSVGTTGTRLIQQAEIDFVVVDTRMIDSEPMLGSFYEGSNGYGEEATYLTEAQLGKFEDTPGFDLVLDGPVQVFDVRSLRGVPTTGYADRAPVGLPGSWDPAQAALLLLLAGLAVAAARGGRLRVPRWRPRDHWPLAMALPGAMLLGGIGVGLGYQPVVGSVLMIGAAAWLWRRWGVPAPDPASEAAQPARPRSVSPLSAAVVAVLLAAVALATTAAVRAQFGHDELPPPTLPATTSR